MNVVKLVKELTQLPKEMCNPSGRIGEPYVEENESWENLSAFGGVVFGVLFVAFAIVIPLLLFLGIWRP